MEISGGLTDTEVEKLAQLAEGIEFSNVQQYSEKVKLLKESYFNHQPKSVAEINQQQNLFEESNDPRAFTSTPEMSALVNAMSRINKNAKPAPKKIDEKTNAGKLLNMINPNIVSDQYI
jgi:hypothetical protein